LKAKEDKNFMNLEEIKEIIEKDGGKFIIVENGQPIMVILSFDDYKNRLGTQKTLLPKETKPQKEVQRALPKELEDEELKIDDLPL
jgi:PHD/YefM family antitoxin component YafN of YafNO toxin-antitoxin module